MEQSKIIDTLETYQRPSYFWTTWWAYNPQFHRIETWLSCTPYSQGCSSRVASYVIHEPSSEGSSNLLPDTILIPDRFGPLSRPVSGIERLPARSKLPMKPHYFALDIFLSFNSRVTFCHLPRCYRPDSQPCSGSFSRNTPLILP